MMFYLRRFGFVVGARRDSIMNMISSFKEMRIVIPYVLLLFFMQFLMQPLFHYWQPLFGEKFSLNSNEMSVVFIGYSVSMSSVSWGYSRLTHLESMRSDFFIFSAALIASLGYSMIARVTTFNSALLFFAISFGVFNLIQISLGVIVQKKIHNENRMMVSKCISFCSRIGMIISLVMLHLLFSSNWETSDVYKLYGILSTLGFCCCWVWIMIRKNMENKYVYESKN